MKAVINLENADAWVVVEDSSVGRMRFVIENSLTGYVLKKRLRSGTMRETERRWGTRSAAQKFLQTCKSNAVHSVEYGQQRSIAALRGLCEKMDNAGQVEWSEAASALAILDEALAAEAKNGGEA